MLGFYKSSIEFKSYQKEFSQLVKKLKIFFKWIDYIGKFYLAFDENEDK